MLCSKHLKLRILHVAAGTIATRYSPNAPLVVVIFVDMHNVIIRGFTFGLKRVGDVTSRINEGDVVFVNDAEVVPPTLKNTWVPTLLQLKFVDSTTFLVGEPDESFPSIVWNFISITDIQTAAVPATVIGKYALICVMFDAVYSC